MSRLDPLHAAAHALTAVRILPDGALRSYTATTFPVNPWAGCNRMRRIGAATGLLVPTVDDGYAVLDVLDRAGDIVQDFTIPTPEAFRYWYAKLNLRLER